MLKVQGNQKHPTYYLLKLFNMTKAKNVIKQSEKLNKIYTDV
jgi:hypothetical protein